MEEAVYHVPVLLQACVDGLRVEPDGVYADVTFGGGGHSREILSRLGGGGHLYGFDQDADAARNAIPDGRFTFVRSNFRYLIDDGERGFSFRFEGRLDMRMNQSARLTAADVVNDYAEERLAGLFYLYGELRNARRLAACLVKARAVRRIERVSRSMAQRSGAVAESGFSSTVGSPGWRTMAALSSAMCRTTAFSCCRSARSCSTANSPAAIRNSNPVAVSR